LFIFNKVYFTDFLKNIPGPLILTKCDESRYKINDTIVKLQRKLKTLNSLTTLKLNQTNSSLPSLLSLTNTFLSFNPWWKKLNYTKEIINQFNGIFIKDISDDCYDNITLRKYEEI